MAIQVLIEEVLLGMDILGAWVRLSPRIIPPPPRFYLRLPPHLPATI